MGQEVDVRLRDAHRRLDAQDVAIHAVATEQEPAILRPFMHARSQRPESRGGWTTRLSWTATIATFDPPSLDYRRLRKQPFFFKARPNSVDLADTVGRVPSLL